MKLIFGNYVPSDIYINGEPEIIFWTDILNIDALMFHWLANNNNSIETTVNNLLKYFDTEENKDRLFWTCNPMILQYCSKEWVIANVFIVINKNLIAVKEDKSLLLKLDFMGPGEALVDDERIL